MQNHALFIGIESNLGVKSWDVDQLESLVKDIQHWPQLLQTVDVGPVILIVREVDTASANVGEEINQSLDASTANRFTVAGS